MSTSWTVAVASVLTMMVHVLHRASRLSTTPSRNMSTTVSTPSLTQLIRTTSHTRISLPRAVVRLQPITLYWLSMCLRQPHCQRCQRSLSPTRTAISWLRTSMISGTISHPATCLKTGTMPNRYVRRCSTSSLTVS